MNSHPSILTKSMESDAVTCKKENIPTRPFTCDMSTNQEGGHIMTHPSKDPYGRGGTRYEKRIVSWPHITVDPKLLAFGGSHKARAKLVSDQFFSQRNDFWDFQRPPSYFIRWNTKSQQWMRRLLACNEIRISAQTVLDLRSWMHIQQVHPLIAWVGWVGAPLLINELACMRVDHRHGLIFTYLQRN